MSNENKDTRVALCLSGGGLRATLFHLGVVKALRKDDDHGEMLLKQVDEVYAVSGGSILAAHMLVNWSRYTDPDDAVFAEVEKEIRGFASLNIRDRILRRWFLTRGFGLIVSGLSRIPIIRELIGNRSGLFSRTYWLQKQYESEELIGKIGLGQANSVSGMHPKFHFLSTSFKTGKLCSFSGDRFEIEPRDDDWEMARGDPPLPLTTPCGNLRLGFAVAASSAFPPMFPPIVLTDDQLANPKQDEFLNGFSLSDGGVYDNLGIEKFRRNMARNPTHPAKLIISDAGASFRASTEESYSSLFSRNVRASDILMDRVSEKLKTDVRALDDKIVRDITIRIGDSASNADVDETVQQRLRLVRTDLDRFDDMLAGLLIGHGARLAKPELAKLFNLDPLESPEPISPSTEETERLDKVALRAANRSFWSLPFGKDWVRPIFLPVFLVAAVIIFGSIPWGIFSIKKLIDSNSQLITLNRNLKDEKERSEDQALYLKRRVSDSRSELNNVLKSCFDNREICGKEKYIRLAGLLDLTIDDAQKIAVATESMPAVDVNSTVEENNRVSMPTEPLPRNDRFGQTIYIQFAGALAREQIKGLNAKLSTAGWNVQGSSGERIATASGLNEVRYSGDNHLAAQDLAAAINRSGVPLAKEVGIKQVKIIGSNDLEVWISR